MRRFFVILAGLSLVGGGLGCQHTAGRCDCSPITPPCCKYGLYAGEAVAPTVAIQANTAPAAPAVMPNKEKIGMPREGGF